MTHTFQFSRLISTAVACLTVTGSAGVLWGSGETLQAGRRSVSVTSTTTVDQPPLITARLGSKPTTSFTDAQQSLVDFAFDRFSAAGFSRPQVAIEFPDDRTECFGYGGVYLPQTKTVRVCWMVDSTIVHELAHAWLDETLDDTERAAFLSLRQLNGWVNGGEWDERGAEHAAEIITWGILDRNISIRWIEPDGDGTATTTWRLAKLPDDSDPDGLFEAFDLLTGNDASLRRADDPRTTPTTTILSPEAKR